MNMLTMFSFFVSPFAWKERTKETNGKPMSLTG
jgi:hypothetical protein